MKPEIRDLSSCSLPDLYALFKDVYSSSPGMSEVLEDKHPDLVSFQEDMTTLQSLPGTVALTAEVARQPVAHLTIQPRRETRLRHTPSLNMGVALSARGRGIGGALLRAGLDRAVASATLEIVYLVVRSDNAPAIHLYRKMGFQVLTILTRDTKSNGSYFDGLLMPKFVDASPIQDSASSLDGPSHLQGC